MTEAEWLACRTSRKMLAFIRARATERQLRLAGCGCFRVCVQRISLAEHRLALDVAERMADGTATGDEIEQGWQAADFARNMATGTLPTIPRRYKARAVSCASWALYGLVDTLVLAPSSPEFLEVIHNELGNSLDYLSEIDGQYALNRVRQARVIRDIFGNPFRPVTFDPNWRTSTVVALTEGIYADRVFDRLPVLADALQDAGCDHQDVLDHCRGPGPHVRGCWVVDLILGKS